ncbi:MAG: phosphonate metabolism protein/1,5-bisphosphokinase (PRPP-forming) PhnN [Pseudomonadota bacterium]
MAGRIFAVVGPSGAGKDTLMAEAATRHPALYIARRTITRPEEAGGEPFEGVSEAEFARRKAAGDFLLDWQAHGLCYGIGRDVDRAVGEGRDVLFNGSRGVLGRAWEAFPNLSVIHVTASAPVLAARLAARGRESAEDIERRLARAAYEIPNGPAIRVVQNDGDLADAVAAFVAALSR